MTLSFEFGALNGFKKIRARCAACPDQAESPCTSQAQFSEAATIVASSRRSDQNLGRVTTRSPQVTTRSLHHEAKGSLHAQKSSCMLAEVQSQLSTQPVCRSRRWACAQTQAAANPKLFSHVEALLEMQTLSQLSELLNQATAGVPELLGPHAQRLESGLVTTGSPQGHHKVTTPTSAPKLKLLCTARFGSNSTQETWRKP